MDLMEVFDQEDQQTFRCALVIFEDVGCWCFNDDLAIHDDVKEFTFVTVLKHRRLSIVLGEAQVTVQVLDGLLLKHC